MLVEYPKKFSFTGVVELTYTDYFSSFPSTGSNNEYHTSFFQQVYSLGARGFIYHPRLAVFDVSIHYRDERQLANVNGAKVNSHSLGYDLRSTFLPYRPISLTVYAGNIDYKIEPVGNFINPLWAVNQDINYNYYGASLKINKPPLPFMRIEFNHEEQGLFNPGNIPGKIRSDEYLLDFRGNLRLWNTVYLGTLQYVDFSSPSVSYHSRLIRLLATSTIRSGLYMQNSFNYSDIDFSKLLSFSSQLNIDKGQLFKQFYYYNFLQSEESFTGLQSQEISGQTQKETINSIIGSWIYRFVSGPATSLSLNYGRRKESNLIDESANFYGIGLSVSYARSFSGFMII